jgi:methionyl-tRNA synthetase
VGSVFARASPDLAQAGPQGRVEPAFAYLSRDYLSHYGPVVRMTLPLPWGVPWDVPEVEGARGPTAGSVHSSYITGKYASTRLVGQAYAERFGVDPFARDSTVTTVAVGGLDSAMGWLALLALTGPELDFRPFDYTVVNRFMLLHGSKFSTSRRHVIRVNDALERGLSSDAIRLMLARTSPGTQESDFVPEDAAKRSRDDATLLADALRRGADITDPAPAAADQRAFLDAAADCLLRQREAFALPQVDLPAAAEALGRWAHILRHGQLAGDPLVGREVLAVLAYPLIPGWAAAVWRSAGHDGPDGPDRIGSEPWTTRAPAPMAAESAMPPVTAEELSALVERGRRAR